MSIPSEESIRTWRSSVSGALPKLPSATQSSASVWFDHYKLINYAEERGELPAYELHDLTGLALSPGTGQQALLADIKAWLTRGLTLQRGRMARAYLVLHCIDLLQFELQPPVLYPKTTTNNLLRPTLEVSSRTNTLCLGK